MTDMMLHQNDPGYADSLIDTSYDPLGDEPFQSPSEKKTSKKAATGGDGGGGGQQGPTVATKLLELAESLYDFGCSMSKEAFAVPKSGAQIARMIVKGDTALRNELAAEYRKAYKTVPSEQAVREAVGIITHLATLAEPTALYLRIAPNPGGGIIVDLGDATGEAVIITAAGWHIALPPVLFRRTPLTAAFPRPLVNGRLEDLRPLLNVGDDAWTLVKGYLLASLTPDIPRPVGLVVGEQGTGKSDFCRMLALVIDASPAPVRSLPRDEDNWIIAANASWMIALDNVSNIAEWLSDSICKASTGDAMIKRSLYTNTELSIVIIQRSILLNTIDAGSLRGDLADRMVAFELERIAPGNRMTEAEIRAAYDAVWPSILGGLYTLMARVLAALPTVQMDNPPRMADFAHILAAMDEVTGTNAIELYRQQSRHLSADVVAGDAVASAVVLMMTSKDIWEGSATELLKVIYRPDGLENRKWPADARALSARLRRAAPALAKIGLNCEEGGRTAKGRSLQLTKLKHYESNVEATISEATAEEDPF